MTDMENLEFQGMEEASEEIVTLVDHRIHFIPRFIQLIHLKYSDPFLVAMTHLVVLILLQSIHSVTTIHLRVCSVLICTIFIVPMTPLCLTLFSHALPLEDLMDTMLLKVFLTNLLLIQATEVIKLTSIV